MEGWIKLHRAFAKWEWSDEPFMVSLFIHLIVAASNRDTKWKGEIIKRGQLIFGRKKWATKTGISEQSIRTCLKKLQMTGEINLKSTNGYSIITICNYEKYQAVPGTKQPREQPLDQPATNQRPTSDQPHRKKEKKEKKEKNNTEPDEPIFNDEIF
jgi:hypothetical protein